MPRASSQPAAETEFCYKRPFYNPRLKREEAQADVQLIKRLIREAKASGFDSGGRSQGSGSPQ